MAKMTSGYDIRYPEDGGNGIALQWGESAESGWISFPVQFEFEPLMVDCQGGPIGKITTQGFDLNAEGHGPFLWCAVAWAMPKPPPKFWRWLDPKEDDDA